MSRPEVALDSRTPTAISSVTKKPTATEVFFVSAMKMLIQRRDDAAEGLRQDHLAHRLGECQADRAGRLGLARPHRC